MADWTNIPDTALDPDAPLTSELAYAWRDNPIAIAEGAAGAPRITRSAILNPSAGNLTTVTSGSASSSDVGDATIFIVSAITPGSATVSINVVSTGGSAGTGTGGRVVRVRNNTRTVLNSQEGVGSSNFNVSFIYGDIILTETYTGAPGATATANSSISVGNDTFGLVVIPK